ncbi:hypothetical protein ABT034_24000 [Streptomyces sp. NPDC002773]|uniref:hypothetical protein n=1 Tax=Streptomyces sp. NPDC002773 TaxID=3154430 RepID=UPI00331A3B24
MRPAAALLLMSALPLGLAGCGDVEQRASAARSAALDFGAALRASDPERACAALAPGTREEVEQDGPCPTVLADLDPATAAAGEPVATDVYGEQARVVFARDSVFLASFPDGWKVTAAGCTPRPGRPARCEVKAD